MVLTPWEQLCPSQETFLGHHARYAVDKHGLKGGHCGMLPTTRKETGYSPRPTKESTPKYQQG